MSDFEQRDLAVAVPSDAGDEATAKGLSRQIDALSKDRVRLLTEL